MQCNSKRLQGNFFKVFFFQQEIMTNSVKPIFIIEKLFLKYKQLVISKKPFSRITS